MFQLVKPFHANLHSTNSQKYSYMYTMTTKINYFFLQMSIINMQNFTLISNRGNKKLSSQETAGKFDKRSLQKCLRITFYTYLPVNHYHFF